MAEAKQPELGEVIMILSFCLRLTMVRLVIILTNAIQLARNSQIGSRLTEGEMQELIWELCSLPCPIRGNLHTFRGPGTDQVPQPIVEFICYRTEEIS